MPRNVLARLGTQGLWICLLLPGCLLDRSPDPEGERDASAPLDAGAPLDAAAPRDSGTAPDAGPSCVPSAELCNGLDDDCDPSTPDGADEPDVGVACDGDDRGLCAGGTVACVAGSLACIDDDEDRPDERERCNGDDDDCDPSTPDGADEAELGERCDGDDPDACAGGAWACTDGMMVCVGDEPVVEACNGLDDDCDGVIDEVIDGDAGCPCSLARREMRPYLFCGAGSDTRSWGDARAFCVELGYDLATIDDEAEQRWMAETALARSRSDWWLGATDQDALSTEGTFVWAASGEPVSYTNWSSGEPNNLAGEDCMEMWPDARSPGDVPGAWNDEGCSNRNRFVCEVTP